MVVVLKLILKKGIFLINPTRLDHKSVIDLLGFIILNALELILFHHVKVLESLFVLASQPEQNQDHEV